MSRSISSTRTGLASSSIWSAALTSSSTISAAVPPTDSASATRACRAANPRIVYCAISGFGAEGPIGEDKAYDTVIQALSGIMMLSGEEGDPPVKIGMPFADLISPLFGLIGILAALRVRDTRGEGQFVDISMLGAVTSLVASEPFDLLERLGIPRAPGTARFD